MGPNGVIRMKPVLNMCLWFTKEPLSPSQEKSHDSAGDGVGLITGRES